jgi:hypothetical protein
MSSPAEFLSKLEQSHKERAPIYTVIAKVADDNGSGGQPVFIQPGLGLIADVIVVTAKLEGARLRCQVGGSIFYKTKDGAFHNEPLSPGDFVLVSMLDGEPDGQCVIIARVPNETMPEPDSVAWQTTHDRTITQAFLHKFAAAKPIFLESDGSDFFWRMVGQSAFTVKFPDGSVFSVQPNTIPKDYTDLAGLPEFPQNALDTLNGPGYQMKIKHSNGAAIIWTGRGLKLSSPNGSTYLEITDGKIVANTPVFQTTGKTFLCWRPSDTSDAPLHAALMGSIATISLKPLTPVPADMAAAQVRSSVGVFFGRGFV